MSLILLTYKTPLAMSASCARSAFWLPWDADGFACLVELLELSSRYYEDCCGSVGYSSYGAMNISISFWIVSVIHSTSSERAARCLIFAKTHNSWLCLVM
jgi:hypothetical protein